MKRDLEDWLFIAAMVLAGLLAAGAAFTLIRLFWLFGSSLGSYR